MAGGSWEILDSNAVLCAILHTDVTTIQWSFGLRNLQIPGRDELRTFYPFLPVAGMPYDHARNFTAMKAIEVGAKYLFCYDSDVVPPRDTIQRLIKHNLPIVSGMYCRRSPPHGVPVAIKNGTWLKNFKPGQLVEVDVVGAGCLLIRRDVLEKMPPQDAHRGKHWFDWRVDMQHSLPPGEAMSEDFTFCLAARRLGYKIMLDTGIQCGHVGLAEARLNSFLPCAHTPVT